MKIDWKNENPSEAAVGITIITLWLAGSAAIALANGGGWRMFGGCILIGLAPFALVLSLFFIAWLFQRVANLVDAVIGRLTK